VKDYIDIEMQNMEVTVIESSQALYNSLTRRWFMQNQVWGSWKKKNHVIKIGVWKLKGVGRNSDQGFAPCVAKGRTGSMY
jgi:hypothetical protein